MPFGTSNKKTVPFGTVFLLINIICYNKDMRRVERERGSILVIVLIVIIIALAGVFLWYFDTHQQPEVIEVQSTPATSTAPTVPTPAPQAAAVNPMSSSTQDQQPAMPQAPAPSNKAEESTDLAAASVTTIPTTETFTLNEYPQASFTISDLSVGTGGVIDPYCGSLWQDTSAQYMFIHDEPPGASPSGTCFNTTIQVDGQTPRVVAFTLTTNNNGPSDVYGIFVRGAYNLSSASGTVYRIAHYIDNWGGYGVFLR